ncbi:MAG: LL-diaminopimelate aminotransferase [Clostridia bacterium]|nr:LL-diaminopimelate aminotransferase [Clostridia bacterium]
MKYNREFSNFKNDYIFAKLKKTAEEMKRQGKEVVDLGVGDLSLPLFPVAVEEMIKSVKELGEKRSFTGYPPAEGLLSLREKISLDYGDLGISPSEIFISDGAKSDVGNLLDLFGTGISVLVPTPAYPAYAEANLFAGNKVTFLPCFKEDDFIPIPPVGKIFDVIYLCSPNNPTGSAFDKRTLSRWINYALSTGAVVLYDGAYCDFASENEVKSVYEIKNAEYCAVEIRSFSKSFGFTGVRCGYCVIPETLGEYNRLWKRRLSFRFNGVSVISQKGAEAYFSEEGRAAVKKRINYYKNNAEIIKIALKKKNLWYNNSCSSPYVFAKTPEGFSSEEFCDRAIKKFGIVLTPGNSFGEGGEGFFRISAFPERDKILKAVEITDKY